MGDPETRNAFNLYDREGRGKCPTSELGPCLRALGLNPTQAQVTQLTSEVLRGNSTFSHDDLIRVMQHANANPTRYGFTEDLIRDAFKVFDREGCGFVSAAELRHVVTSLGEKLSEKEADLMIQEIDVNADGMISVDDLVSHMKAGRP